MLRIKPQATANARSPHVIKAKRDSDISPPDKKPEFVEIIPGVFLASVSVPLRKSHKSFTIFENKWAETAPIIVITNKKGWKLPSHTYAPTVPKTTGMSITGIVPNRVIFLNNVHLSMPRDIPFYIFM
ncbi:hypothetical protein D3C79_921230 [compost metagenome]